MTYVTQEDFSELKNILSGMAQTIQSLAEKKTQQSAASTISVQEGTENEYQENVPVTQLAALTTTVNELRMQTQAQALEIAKGKKLAEFKDIENFVDLQIRERRVLPKERQSKIDLLKSVPGDATMSFTDHDGKTFKKSSRQVLMENISQGPQLWSEGDIPSGFDFEVDPTAIHRYAQYEEMGVDMDSIRLDAKIREFASSRGLDPEDPDGYNEAYTKYTRASRIVQQEKEIK